MAPDAEVSEDAMDKDDRVASPLLKILQGCFTDLDAGQPCSFFGAALKYVCRPRAPRYRMGPSRPPSRGHKYDQQRSTAMTLTADPDTKARGGSQTTSAGGMKPPSMTMVPTDSFLIKNLDRIYKYPDVVRINFRINDIYLVTDPSMIQEVLVTKQRQFIKGEFLQNTKKVFGEGLLTSEGDFHHRQRRLVQPAFHHDRIKAYAGIITRYEELLTADWRDGETLDIHGEMTKLTMSIIAKCLFDTDVESDSTSISEDLTLIIDYFNRLSSPISNILQRLPSNRKYQRAVQHIDAFVYRMIKERRESPKDEGDLMSMLLSAKDEDGSEMSDSQVRDEVLITFAAGHETTSNALTWTWYLLSQNQEVQEKMHAEVDAVVRPDAPPSIEDLPRLEYTHKVLTESMRLFPPAWILSREALTDCVVGGYLLPKGATIAVSQYATHHNPKFFTDPERFDPGRWTPEMRTRLPKLGYFPFGAGARNCVGEPFAWMEGVLLLAAISRRWEMRHVPGHKVEVLPRITLRPKYGMMMKLHRR
jgi:cytochrome P450